MLKTHKSNKCLVNMDSLAQQYIVCHRYIINMIKRDVVNIK